MTSGPPELDSTESGRGTRERNRSLSNEAAWVLTGNVVFAASQWVLLIVLAKIGSVEDVGLFALANAIAAPLFMLSDLNLRAYLATDASSEFPFSTYLTCRAIMSSFALGAIGAWQLVLGDSADTAVVLLGVSASKAFESLSTVVLGLYQQKGKMSWLAGSLIFRSMLAVISFSGALYWTHRLDIAVGALAASRVVAFLAYDLVLAKRLSQTNEVWRTRDVFSLAIAALPLGVVMMLTSLNANLALYFVESLLGLVAVGHFAALFYLITAARILLNALSQTASPRLAQFVHARDRTGFKRLQGMLMILGMAIGIAGSGVAWLIGEPVLALLYSAEYATHANVLAWLIAANSFSFANTFLGAGLTAMRAFQPMVTINVLTIVVTAGLLALLVPRFGLIGATWAIGGSAALKFALNLSLQRSATVWSRAS